MSAAEYRPQLASLVKEPPAGDAWLHEIKYDGYRIGCRIARGKVALYSRNGKDWTAAFPGIVEAAGKLRVRDALLDGEVAVVLPDGRTSFQALQNALTASRRATLAYFVFDLLALDGKRFEPLPLAERKARLAQLLKPLGKNGPIRYSDHVAGNGADFFRQACAHGLEGIVSKRHDRPHRPGRSPEWLKTKCVLRQEFVIGGFTDPEGSREGIGALLIGHHDPQGQLVFSGKVGTGFTQRTAADLRARLARLERETPPFAVGAPRGWRARGAHWVRPELVAEVAFTEWTADGKIRHPSFQGLRADKPARDVTRERAADAPGAAPPPQPERVVEATVAGVPISHSDRVLYPDVGITKLELAQYCEAVGAWIVPQVRGRPLTLVRCPTGLQGKCFFMKHAKVRAPAPLRRVRIQEKKKVGEYLIADTTTSVVALVQMGVLEIHTWNVDFASVERPNRVVFDLDPGEAVAFRDVVAAAREIRKALEVLELASFVKTTGGKGLHVVVPLVPRADWSECLAFSRALAQAMERAHPARYTTEFAKAGRGRKILIDYLRNNRTNTSIAAYSMRARPHAPVSVPLRWSELTASLDPASFTVRTVPRRLARLRSDPWADYGKVRQRLTARLLKAVGVS